MEVFFKIWARRRTPPEEERDVIRLLSCANLYEEAEATALNVLSLVQSGIHFGDIAVVVRDTEAYRGVLDAAFERYEIPYFMSERTDLSAKPLTRLILSALRAISRFYQSHAVLSAARRRTACFGRFLGTVVPPLSPDQ